MLADGARTSCMIYVGNNVWVVSAIQILHSLAYRQVRFLDGLYVDHCLFVPREKSFVGARPRFSFGLGSVRRRFGCEKQTKARRARKQRMRMYAERPWAPARLARHTPRIKICPQGSTGGVNADREACYRPTGGACYERHRGSAFCPNCFLDLGDR